eukprot:scaffold894_cov153-Cylindrotheca_fusiformis.AAC.5
MENGAAGGGDLGALADMFGDMDPSQLEELAGLGEYFEEIMDVMGKMTPEELEKQMQDAMEMLASGDMMKNMLDMQDEIIKSLEESGQVSPEELAKFKADPEYFEQRMKESFGQMKELFSDPETLKAATEGINSISQFMNNPEADQMLQKILGDFDDDEKIEEMRLQLLKNPDLGIPGLGDMFNTPEVKEALSDPQKWKESVKQSRGLLNGAGVGEL